MKNTREIVGAVLAAAVLGLAAGCGGGGESGANGGSGSDNGAVGDESSGSDTSSDEATEATDFALSIQEIADLTLEGDLDVQGFVVSVGGKTLLCSTASGTPPTCGKPSLVLVDYEGDVPSDGEIVVTGEVSGNQLVVRD